MIPQYHQCIYRIITASYLAKLTFAFTAKTVSTKAMTPLDVALYELLGLESQCGLQSSIYYK